MATGAVPARISLASASFAAGLEYEPDTDSQRARLALDLVETEDFSSGFGPFTEVDSGANVAAGGGALSVLGTTAWNVNGVYLTTSTDYAKPGAFEIDVTPEAVNSSVNGMIGFTQLANLDQSEINFFKFYPYATNNSRIQHAGTAVNFGNNHTMAAGVTVTLRFEWTVDKRFIIKFDGVSIFETDANNVGAGLRFMINQYSPNTWNYTNWKRYYGYKTSSPVATLADVDSGADDSVWDMSTVAFAGSETNLTYSYAYGNTASPSNWSAYLSLANLQAESDPTGRYFKLRVAAASDGATQVEITEGSINAGVALSPDFPAVGNVTEDDTVDGVAGTYHEAAAAEVQLGVAFGAGGTEYTGAYSSAVAAVARPATTAADDGDGTNFTVTIDGEAGKTHQVWYRAYGASTWSDGGTRSGDGTVQVAPGAVGLYEWIVASEAGDNYSPSAAGLVTVSTALGASGFEAARMEELCDELRGSAALANAVTVGSEAVADHVKLGRYLNLSTDSARHTAIVANGPVLYLNLDGAEWSPETLEHAVGELTFTVEIYMAYDQSANDNSLSVMSFVGTLRKEILAEADGAASGWLTNAENVTCTVAGPFDDGPRNEMRAVLTISFTGHDDA